MKTETFKLYSRVFLPNIIKIDLCNFELYRFKFGAFFETVLSFNKILRCCFQCQLLQ